MAFIVLNQNDTTEAIAKKCNENFRRLDGSKGYSAATASAIIDNISYIDLRDKPAIETVELVGDQTFSNLGLNALTNSEIENMLT